MRVRLIDVAHGYGESFLFAPVSAKFDPETATALMGPSGTGKSTLLSIIGGLTEPRMGEVCLIDAGADGPVPTGSTFSWVLQTNTVLAGRSALDNAALSLLAEGWRHSEAREAAMSALHDIGLSHRAHYPIRALSGGEVQRVTIARSLLSDSRVLLADEPTAQLDATNATLVVDALRSAAVAGKTVIIATHDERVAQACDSVLRLEAVLEA